METTTHTGAQTMTRRQTRVDSEIVSKMAAQYRMSMSAYSMSTRALPPRYRAAFRFYNQHIDEHGAILDVMTWGEAKELGAYR